MQQKVVKKFSVISVAMFLVAVCVSLFAVENAQAAGLAQAYVRLDRMQATTFTSGLICARTPATDTGTEAFVKVVFPSDFVVSSVLTNWGIDVTAGTLPSGVTPWPGVAQATAANNATHTVTFLPTNLSINTTYCFRWTDSAAALQTGAAAIDKQGSITTTTSVPADLDNSSYATTILTGSDQVSITATVPPNFSFAITGGSAGVDTFSGSLSPASIISTAGKTGTVITNANNGWVAWVKSANAGLNSASTGASIPASATANDNAATVLSAGTTGYVMDVAFTDAGGGSTGVVSQAANFGQEFDGNGTTSGGSLETSFRPIVAASGITAGDTFSMVERVAINALQQSANDYTDTLTVIAAGRF